MIARHRKRSNIWATQISLSAVKMFAISCRHSTFWCDASKQFKMATMSPALLSFVASVLPAQRFTDEEDSFGFVRPLVTLWHLLPHLSKEPFHSSDPSVNLSGICSILKPIVVLLFNLIASLFLFIFHKKQKMAVIFRILKPLVKISLEISKRIISFVLIPSFYWLCRTGASIMPVPINTCTSSLFTFLSKVYECVTYFVT